MVRRRTCAVSDPSGSTCVAYPSRRGQKAASQDEAVIKRKKNDRSPSGIFDPGRARRRATRSHHGRAGDADLPDHLVRVQRRRSCRIAVRAAGVGKHLYPHRKPDERRPGGARCGARRRHRWPGGRVRARRASRCAPAVDDARRRAHRGAQTLRWLDQPVHPCLQELRLERGMGRPRRHRQFRARGHGTHQGDLHRVRRLRTPAAASPISRRSRPWPATLAYR